MEKMILHDARELASELANFHDIASYLKARPGEVPRLAGFDIFGKTLPLRGALGGDHIIYLDFKQRYDLEARIAQAIEQGRPVVAAALDRCRSRAGIVLADVSGHRITDALLAAMLHQALLLGAVYELDVFGEITKHLFENLNTRFCNSSGVHKFLTLIYGEIAEDARFRFLSAAHPAPVVFSRLHDRFMEVEPEHYLTGPPLGTLPSRHVIDHKATESVLGFKAEYELNEWKIMGAGDILLVFTDGLCEHSNDRGEEYFPTRLEPKVRELRNHSAHEIVNGIEEDLRSFASLTDDVSLVVIKRTE
jgi:serine phosphatase RsbU (regulator of sigma subunit)